MQIEVFSELEHAIELDPERVQNWLCVVEEGEHKSIGSIGIVFHSDDSLLEVNRQFLQHNYYTDVITFEENTPSSVNGEVHISIDRVRENARAIEVDVEKELRRVIVHGVLHMMGYADNTNDSRALMRELENQYIQ